MPETKLLSINDKEYAGMELVPFNFKTLHEEIEKDPVGVRRFMTKYLVNGTLHDLAFMEYVLGNPDSHGHNIMANIKDGNIRLIDHGSSFAGAKFDPKTDPYTFIPFYLRMFNHKNFTTTATQEDKLKSLPRLDSASAIGLQGWILDIDEDHLKADLDKFGIEPAACLARLAKVKRMVSLEPADLVINKVWTVS